jgi:hypothetical protein
MEKQAIEALKAKSMQMIKDITSLISNNEICILGKTYKVEKVGIHHLILIGSRGAKYTLVTSPRCSVIEEKECNVYSITSRGTSFLITIFNGEFVLLHR